MVRSYKEAEMKVKELIELLEREDQDMEVFVSDHEFVGLHAPLLMVKSAKINKGYDNLAYLKDDGTAPDEDYLALN